MSSVVDWLKYNEINIAVILMVIVAMIVIFFVGYNMCEKDSIGDTMNGYPVLQGHYVADRVPVYQAEAVGGRKSIMKKLKGFKQKNKMR